MCRAMPPNKAKIGGCLSLLQSWARWNHPTSYVGMPTALEDIRLLLDQQSEAQAVILNEFFQNLNIWHVKVSLVNYVTVEMH
ncbi:hypothetical protein Goshw_027834 [Gossypium schwendimanii]|uniref:Uncharacterized protein n=1 Tax=Gossypium schwendimanii TaxID=34291 RepID=A0A7J9MW47_GOSSC|nr:hypothetical protein [Gossypium schwendimanii]